MRRTSEVSEGERNLHLNHDESGCLLSRDWPALARAFRPRVNLTCRRCEGSSVRSTTQTLWTSLKDWEWPAQVSYCISAIYTRGSSTLVGTVSCRTLILGRCPTSGSFEESVTDERHPTQAKQLTRSCHLSFRPEISSRLSVVLYIFVCNRIRQRQAADVAFARVKSTD